MSRLAAFLRHRGGASAAEFALILPLALLILLGIVDVGRYAWALNQTEKAVQAGVRYAVASDLVPRALNTYDTTGFVCPAGALKPGDRICREALGTIACRASAGGATCTCAEGPCPDLGQVDGEAFARIVARMRVFYPQLRPQHVTVTYRGSGIGYLADPATDADDNPLSDIAPVVTVEADHIGMRALLLFGGEVNLPGAGASLTLEDGLGTKAY